jgi:MFS family permease
MLTMPLAGVLADRIGPGKVVLTGMVLVTIGMAMFIRLDATTPYTTLLAALFVMGLGMGGTMMPMMAAALATLTDHNIARGSTLMNIVQQVAASVGTALFSVLLTNNLKTAASPAQAAEGYADVFVVATVLVATVLVPALFLPRRKPAAPVDPAALMAH